ncbi:MAG: hypothetical protein II796_03160 [Oscillospiraceae bacterium]|nr:hypothetical protein [Oscillospiraceae bacterium]
MKEAIKEYDEAAETLRVHTKDAQEAGLFDSTTSKVGAGITIVVGAYEGFSAGSAGGFWGGVAGGVVGALRGLISEFIMWDLPDQLQIGPKLKEDAEVVKAANEKVMGAATLFTTAKTQLGYHIKEAEGKNLDKLDDLELPTTRQEIRRLFGV